MTVSELIAALQKMPGDSQVVTDGEFTSIATNVQALPAAQIGKIVGERYWEEVPFAPDAVVVIIE